jgi:nucleotide-binding universal stress UspA family protein
VPRFEHILFPVDFSEQNCRIAAHVACMAKRDMARVTMLHAIEAPDGAYPGWPATAAAADLRSIAEWKKQRLDTFLAQELADIPVARIVMEGDPASCAVEYVQQEGVDLIMIPTHGHGAFRRFLLGSVTAKLLHDANCPVWTSAHTEELTQPAPFKTILCAVDLSAGSERLARWAADLARNRGAEIKLVHALPEPAAALEIEGGRFHAALRERAVALLAELQRKSDMPFETVIESGDAAQVIGSAAREYKADLVVIGRGVMNQLLGRMRTHVYSIVRESPCPVISVPLAV